jgi:hypothetical protein
MLQFLPAAALVWEDGLLAELTFVLLVIIYARCKTRVIVARVVVSRGLAVAAVVPPPNDWTDPHPRPSDLLPRGLDVSSAAAAKPGYGGGPTVADKRRCPTRAATVLSGWVSAAGAAAAWRFPGGCSGQALERHRSLALR